MRAFRCLPAFSSLASQRWLRLWPTLAASLALLLAANPAAQAQTQAKAQTQAPAQGFSGVWQAELVDDFGRPQRCVVELSATGSIMGGFMASARGCAGDLMSLSRWRGRGRELVLVDISGATLAVLRDRGEVLSGRMTSGRPLRLYAGAGRAQAVAPRPGCVVYYGQSSCCADARDLTAPALAPGQQTSLRIVSLANVRVAPSFSAALVGQAPVNACLQTDACLRQPDGSQWCRVQLDGRTGYITKLFERDGRRFILFSNGCVPGRRE